MSDKPIYVTEPFLPPLEEFIPYLEEIWESKRLTNNGPMHERLEEALCEYLGVPEIALCNNGTTALILALKALDITGEVITTPFTFIATSHSLKWQGIAPVFVDIDPDTLNIDVTKIEAAITHKTSAILAVHCYGNPCDVEAIKKIATKHGLKVIYDAAHAFGVKDTEGSILRHGDLSAVSFHATKVFSTFEGGAIICPDKETKEKIKELKNFGIIDEITVKEVGINGKMAEINAAFGLLQLKHIKHNISKRKAISDYYDFSLESINGITPICFQNLHSRNYSYYPVLVEKPYPLDRDQLYQRLKSESIMSRRYFYPLVTEQSMYKDERKLNFATEAARKILCLPLHDRLCDKSKEKIINTIRSQLK